MTAAELGSGPRHPQILDPEDLDLSALREHCKAMHKADKIRGGRKGHGHGPMPRSNADLAAWHFGQHWRHGGIAHRHFGPWTLVRNRRTRSTTGHVSRPLGWFTGQFAKTRAQLDAEWRERHPRPGVQRDTDGTILRGPSLPCGCPLDAGCDGRHPGRLA